MNVRYTDWGIAYCYGNIIEVNKVLLKYPKFYKEVLKHEKGHSNKGLDFLHDIKEDFSFSREKLKFMFRHLLLLLRLYFLSGIIKKSSMLICTTSFFGVHFLLSVGWYYYGKKR